MAPDISTLGTGTLVKPILTNGQQVTVDPVAVPAGSEVLGASKEETLYKSSSSIRSTPSSDDSHSSCDGSDSITSTDSDGTKDPDASDDKHVTTPLPETKLSESTFTQALVEGFPLHITNLKEPNNPDLFTPKYLVDHCGAQTCTFVSSQTDATRKGTVQEFFSTFGHYDAPGRENTWKLKDWPGPAGQEIVAEIARETARVAPMGSYCRRDGVLNLASHWPTSIAPPDLGAFVLAFYCYETRPLT